MGVLPLLAAAYLTLWPVPIEPVGWTAPRSNGYTGPHAVNTRLANIRIISLGTEEGPEHIAVDKLADRPFLRKLTLRLPREGRDKKGISQSSNRRDHFCSSGRREDIRAATGSAFAGSPETDARNTTVRLPMVKASADR
jgi:hypothetical protein